MGEYVLKWTMKPYNGIKRKSDICVVLSAVIVAIVPRIFYSHRRMERQLDEATTKKFIAKNSCFLTLQLRWI